MIFALQCEIQVRNCFRFNLIFSALLAILIVAVCGLSVAFGASSGVYIIYDSSNSMWAELLDKSRRYEATRKAIQTLMTRDFGGRDVALRVYGSRSKNSCSDSRLVVDFNTDETNRQLIVDAVNAARPNGGTPIHRSLSEARKDFGNRNGSIILISDGSESCRNNPCTLVKEWRDQGVGINVHVVGIGLTRSKREAMQCIADASGTAYQDANSADQLAQGLDNVLSQITSGKIVQAIKAPKLPVPRRKPAPRPDGVAFKLVVRTSDGAKHNGQGQLIPLDGGEAISITTDEEYLVPFGDYELSAGVSIIGDTPYNPVSTLRSVVAINPITATVTAPLPPQVSAQFQMVGIAIKPSVVSVYDDGKKLGTFNGGDTAFVGDGLLEFRTNPTGTSQNLTLLESFSAGDHKTLAFNAEKEIYLRVQLKLTATGEFLLGAPATVLSSKTSNLTQEITSQNGGIVSPGSYSLRADDGVNSYEKDIDVTDEIKQSLEVDIPSGSVTIQFRDANGKRQEARQVYVERRSDYRREIRKADRAFALIPGEYQITSFPDPTLYPVQNILIGAGDSIGITFKATN